MVNQENDVDLKSATQSDERKLFIETYGCQMNVADSEVVASIMKMDGYSMTENIEEADAIFVNTCSVRDNAEQKIYGRLQYFQSLKRKKKSLIVGVLGCMAERVKEDLIHVHHADLVVGPDSYLDLPNLVGAVEHGEKAINVELSTQETYKDVIPLKLPGVHISGFVSIMRGCNNFCTYCIVPYVRGRERSRSIENIVDEVRQAVAKGYKEFTLLGQNVNSYGKDFGVKDQFAKLLRRVNEIPGVERIRYMTSHPRDMHEDVIKAVAECEHICENFHIPFQSGSNKILKAMNRGYTREKYLELVAMIRRYVPEAAITTDIIVGFPGETEADFSDTLNLVKEVGFDAAFTFIYSKRSGTPAAAMEEQVPLEIKKARLNLLMEAQNISSLQRNEAMVGKTLEVLAEGPSNNNNKVWSGRTRTNKLVLWPVEGRDFELGDKVQVQIETAQTWLLKGKAVE